MRVGVGRGEGEERRGGEDEEGEDAHRVGRYEIRYDGALALSAGADAGCPRLRRWYQRERGRHTDRESKSQSKSRRASRSAGCSCADAGPACAYILMSRRTVPLAYPLLLIAPGSGGGSASVIGRAAHVLARLVRARRTD